VIVYKVVRKENGRFFSLIMGPSSGLRAEYRVNKWAEAPAGPLMAFCSEEEARSYRRKAAGTRIFKAKAVASKARIPDLLPTFWCLTFDRAKAWWNRRLDKRTGSTIVPKGTVLCRRIMLLEDVTHG